MSAEDEAKQIKLAYRDLSINDPEADLTTPIVLELPSSIVARSSIESLTVVPGLLGELVDWIVKSARRPNRVLALGAAVTIVGTLIGRRVAGPTKSATHLYCVALAGTAAGKQHAIDCIKNVLLAAGAGDLIGPGNFASSQGVVKLLKRKPASLCAMDEIGSFLRRINNRNAGHFEREITGELRKIWGICWSRYDSSESAAVESQAVECPALSIYGVSTPEDFYSSLKSEDVGNGFLNRFIILETGQRGPEQEPFPGSDKIQKDMEVKLKNIYRPTPFSIPILRTTISTGKLEPSERLGWGINAKEIYATLSSAIDEETDSQRLKLRSRVPEIAIRLATIRAAGRNSPLVGADDMVWGRDLALHSADMLCSGVAKHMVVEFEFAEICTEIVRRTSERGGRMSRRDILRSFEKHVKRGVDIHAALKHLVESEQLLMEVIAPERGGRQSVLYRILD